MGVNFDVDDVISTGEFAQSISFGSLDTAIAFGNQTDNVTGFGSAFNSAENFDTGKRFSFGQHETAVALTVLNIANWYHFLIVCELLDEVNKGNEQRFFK